MPEARIAPLRLGLQEAVLSVFDIESIARPMVEVGGYRRVALADAPAGQYRVWRVPEGCQRIEQLLLVPPPTEGQQPADANQGSAGGCLRLVKFHGVPQRVMRSSQRSWDTGGIFDVDVYSRDVERVYRQLQRHGWTALGEPVEYSEAHFHVRQVVAVGPSGLMLAIIQRFAPPVEGLAPDAAMSAVFNSTQMVRDYAAGARFLVDVLGWQCAVEFRVDDAVEPGADVLGLPMPQARSARRWVGLFHPPGVTNAIVELIENRSMYGRAFGEHCVAPNVGLLCLRVAVPEAARYAEQVLARGASWYSAPVRLRVEPYGETVMFSVRSPEGAILEFFDAGRG